MNRKDFVEIAKSSLRKWQNHNATLRAAALAFFIILPLPSVLLISADVYSQLYGQTQGMQLLIQQVSALLGPTIGTLVSQLLQGASDPLSSVYNSVFSIVFAIAGVIGAFAVLQDTFNVVWDVKPSSRRRSIKTRLRERVVPFDLVLGASAITLALLEFTNLFFSSIHGILETSVGSFTASAFLLVSRLIFSFGSGILLFAIIFKELPDTRVDWGDVWLGAVISGIAFTAANNLFTLYLETFPVTSLEIAAGSLIILLLWVFVIAQVLLYGAQFTKCFAETVGSHAKFREDHEHRSKRHKVGKDAKMKGNVSATKLDEIEATDEEENN